MSGGPIPFSCPRGAAPADRWYVLAVLTVTYALNIADRFSISTLIEPIRLELHLSDSGIAFLTGVALALFYVTVGIPIAALADRVNRRNILAIAIAVWSSMTALCGLAQNYGSSTDPSPASAPVPEPGACVPIAAALLAFRRRRQRRDPERNRRGRQDSG